MANRAVSVTLRANVADFKRQIDSSSQSLDQLARKAGQSAGASQTALGRMAQSAELQRESWDRAGATLVGFGAATVGALGVSAKAAVDWESSWAGVTKTVDDTDANLASLQGGLRDMARELPATHSEIAAVAEAAGQLGIQTGAIEGFTRTMIDMGEATNLTADEAATSLARFANIMGTEQSKFSNLGSSIVDLGNNFATTEREILDMSMRLASAGQQIGLTEGDIFGLATALSSVGLPAEAAGSAFSRVMVEMRGAVDESGSALETFASTAGMSAEQFAAAFRDDAGGAITAFVAGLGRMEEQGQNTQPVLNELGLTDLRVGNALRASSSAADMFAEAMATGNAAFDENVALSQEAANRYETTASKLAVMRNNIADAGISLGEVFLPAIGEASEAAADFFGWMAQLPEPVQATIGTLGGVAGAASLAGGGFLLLFPRAMETYKAFRDLRGISPRLATGLGKVGRAAGVAGAALSAAAVAGGLFGQKADDSSIEEYTQALLDMGDAAARNEDTPRIFNDLGAAAEQLTNPSVMDNIDDFIGRLSGFFGVHSDMEVTRQGFEDMGEALANLYESDPDLAAERFEIALRETGFTTEELLELMPAYRDALTETDNQQRIASESTAQLAEEQEAAQKATEEWFEMMSGAGDTFGGVAEAYQGVIDKSREMAEQAASDSESMEDSWEDFYDGSTVSMEDWITALEEQAGALRDWGDNAIAAAELVREEMPPHLQAAAEQMLDDILAMGEEGAPMLQAFIDAAPGQRQELVEAYSGTGDEVADEIATEVDAALSEQPTKLHIEADTSRAITDLAEYGQHVDDQTYGTHIEADTGQALLDLGGYLLEVDGSSGTVSINGDRVPAESTLADLLGNVNESDGTVDLLGNRIPADITLDDLLRLIDGSVGVADIAGDDREAQRELSNLLHTVRISGASIWIDADTSSARSALDQVIGEYNGRTVTVYQRMARMGQSEFWSGGYTGDGGKYEPAGIVHRGEWVTTKERTAQYRPVLQAIHQGTYPRLPSYAAGGPVAAMQPASYGWSTPSVNVTAPSLEGLAITGRLALDGDGFVRLIDGRVEAGFQRESTWR